jgi:hypothetical protein
MNSGLVQPGQSDRHGARGPARWAAWATRGESKGRPGWAGALGFGPRPYKEIETLFNFPNRFYKKQSNLNSTKI